MYGTGTSGTQRRTVAAEDAACAAAVFNLVIGNWESRGVQLAVSDGRGGLAREKGMLLLLPPFPTPPWLPRIEPAGCEIGTRLPPT